MTSKSEEKSSVEKSQENQSDESELDSGDEQFIEEGDNNFAKKSKYDCAFCGETFSNENILSGHLKLAHSKFENSTNNGRDKKNADPDATITEEEDNISDGENLEEKVIFEFHGKNEK